MWKISGSLLCNTSIIGSNDALTSQFGRLINMTTHSHLQPGTIDILGTRITLENKDVILFRLNLLSGGSSERNRSNYYKRSIGCIILFDKNEVDYDRSIAFWFKEFKKAVREPSIPIFIIGIKSNKDEDIKLEAKQLAEQINAPYYESTITDKELITQIFTEMAIILEKYSSEFLIKSEAEQGEKEYPYSKLIRCAGCNKLYSIQDFTLGNPFERFLTKDLNEFEIKTSKYYIRCRSK